MTSQEGSPPVPPDPAGNAAMRVGPFVVLDEIGAGGDARVFRARYQPQDETSPLPIERGAVMVLKVMRKQMDMAHDEAEALSREADLLVMLDHPNIVQAVTRGVHAGHVWVALEYVEGEDLGNVFAALTQAELRMRPEVVLTIGTDIAAALAAAHALTDPRGRPLGLVHRDVSPRNILVDLGGNVRLVDFGTATMTMTDPDAGAVVGSPGYMAPEQARGEPLSAAADVHAVGLILWELLTGRRAYPVESLPDEVILQTHAASQRQPWPSLLELSPDIRQVIDACCAPDPIDRPSDGSELYHMLSPLAGDLEDGRYRLSVVARDLVLSNSDRPAPLFVQQAQ